MDSCNSIKCQWKVPSSAPAASSAHWHSQGQTNFGSLWNAAVHWKQVVHFLKIIVTCVTPLPGNTVKSLTFSYFHGSTTPKMPPTSWTKQHKYILDIQQSWKLDRWWPKGHQDSWGCSFTNTEARGRLDMHENRSPSSIKTSDCPLAWWLKRKQTDGNTWYIFWYLHEMSEGRAQLPDLWLWANRSRPQQAMSPSTCLLAQLYTPSVGPTESEEGRVGGFPHAQPPCRSQHCPRAFPLCQHQSLGLSCTGDICISRSEQEMFFNKIHVSQ